MTPAQEYLARFDLPEPKSLGSKDEIEELATNDFVIFIVNPESSLTEQDWTTRGRIYLCSRERFSEYEIGTNGSFDFAMRSPVAKSNDLDWANFIPNEYSDWLFYCCDADTYHQVEKTITDIIFSTKAKFELDRQTVT